MISRPAHMRGSTVKAAGIGSLRRPKVNVGAMRAERPRVMRPSARPFIASADEDGMGFDSVEVIDLERRGVVAPVVLVVDDIMCLVNYDVIEEPSVYGFELMDGSVVLNLVTECSW